MKPLVVSVPRSGTRFYVFFLQQICGLEVEYAHFGFDDIEPLLERAGVIIVPQRSEAAIRESWGSSRPEDLERCLQEKRRLMPALFARQAHFVDIEKNATSIYQWTMLLADLGLQWTDEIASFFREWPVIGSQHSRPNARDDLALSSARDSRAKL